MRWLPAVALLALVACGADGPPLRPGTTTPGITLTGEARIGLSTP